MVQLVDDAGQDCSFLVLLELGEELTVLCVLSDCLGVFLIEPQGNVVFVGEHVLALLSKLEELVLCQGGEDGGGQSVVFISCLLLFLKQG